MNFYTVLLLRGFAQGSAQSSTRSSASGPRYIPDSLSYVATLFFLSILPSLHPPYLGRHQNGSQQRTVARTRRPSPELDDRRQN